ncbi:siphovirus Gp157 family protein [Limosilactobacillus fermentum]|uniref:siphovirus Gp157 family protein n=1 Tax=Limosilactobacillus fermentum TaxID=1613 RepID=UPI0014025190|nr:siphovirus Gp157 family protein [Limosilactobacillus fermentum]
MTTLYKLTDAYRQVLDSEDLDPEVMQDTLDSIKEPLKDKADGIAWVIEKLQADSKLLKDKAKSFNEEAKYRANKAAWLQSYLTDSLDAAGIKKLQTANHILSPRNYKMRTVIDDASKLPGMYKLMKTTVSPDKKAIYAAIKSGEAVSGAHLEPNRKTLIK